MDVRSVLLATVVMVVPLRVWTVVVPQGAAAYARFPLAVQAIVAMIFAWMGFVAWRWYSVRVRLLAIGSAILASSATAVIQYMGDSRFGGWIFWACLSCILLWAWWKEMDRLALEGRQGDS